MRVAPLILAMVAAAPAFAEAPLPDDPNDYLNDLRWPRYTSDAGEGDPQPCQNRFAARTDDGACIELPASARVAMDGVPNKRNILWQLNGN